MTERNIQPNLHEQELLPSKEKLIIRFSGITISGRSGTGKTVVAEKLAELYSISNNRNIKTGQLMREITSSGQQSLGFMERDLETDETMDKMQRDLIVTASLDNPLMLEGRLAGVIASEEKQKNPELKVASILFVAPSETRMKRILKRHQKDRDKNIFALESQIQEAYLTMKEPEFIHPLLLKLQEEKIKVINLWTVKENEKQREIKDLERWRKLHPQLNGIDPFNPANKDSNDKPIYDLIIKTGNLTVDNVVLKIYQELKAKHLVISRNDFGHGNAGEWAYQTILNDAKCEAYKDNITKEHCGQISVGTVDADIRAHLELFPYCSEQHAKQLEKDLIREIESKGGYTVLGRNGFGRN